MTPLSTNIKKLINTKSFTESESLIPLQKRYCSLYSVRMQSVILAFPLETCFISPTTEKRKKKRKSSKSTSRRRIQRNVLFFNKKCFMVIYTIIYSRCTIVSLLTIYKYKNRTFNFFFFFLQYNTLASQVQSLQGFLRKGRNFP